MSVFVIAIGLYSTLLLIIVLITVLRKEEKHDANQPYSVIIAARNEEQNIAGCLNSILLQSLPPESIVVVSDHSTDSTEKQVMEFVDKYPAVRLVLCDDNHTGKRAAIAFALRFMRTTLVVLTTDADCVVGKDWAKEMLESITPEMRLCTGPVVIGEAKGLLSQLQYSELFFLVAGGAAISVIGKTIQVSGANMSFYRNDYLAFFESGYGEHFGSGDDVFFMQFLQKKYGRRSVRFCNKPNVLVETRPEPDTNSWLKQRLRWVLKARGYRNRYSFIYGTLLLLANVSFWTIVVAYFFNTVNVLIAIATLGSKFLSEIMLLVLFSVKWKQKVRWLGILLLPCFYLFFVVGVALYRIFHHNILWKSR
ncbi:MAG: hypothetical protein CVU11_09170 [Bacteroidetes bacterium HGW-Bacteroidetes-6]|jgi:cellulose synthase/poly-beta-1,6-N-acetylglucosamine synthase-like glycosyltransferase|nr:MAG: hypothetical protein CVU11_09170 [Bacteroidetes bacterium HGW-Bacteroidetes-6]